MKPVSWAAAAAVIAVLLGSGYYLLGHGLLADKASPTPRAPVGSVAPEAPLHILLVGTSLTAGGDWPDALGDRLNACRTSRVTIERLALPGATGDWGAAALAERLNSSPLPQLVLVEFTINDARLFRGLSMRTSRRLTERMVAAIARAGATPLLLTMSPAIGVRALGRPWAAAYRAQYGEIAAATGAGLVETVAAFEALPPQELRRAIPDGVHPTNEAMINILVPEMFRQLAPHVCTVSPFR
jgi:lysophospholipase L1-like esterase